MVKPKRSRGGGPAGSQLEVAREHRQRGLGLQEREVAARAEARAGAEGQERLGVSAVGQPAVGIEAGDLLRAARLAGERGDAGAGGQFDAGDASCPRWARRR